MSGPALKAVMRARRVGGPALNAELSLISSAKTHTARRHGKGMICVGGQCARCRPSGDAASQIAKAVYYSALDASRTPKTRLSLRWQPSQILGLAYVDILGKVS